MDRAGHTQTRTRELTVTPDPIRIDLVPESGQLVPGVENLVWVVTSYPDGRPARTTVQVEGGERDRDLRGRHRAAEGHAHRWQRRASRSPPPTRGVPPRPSPGSSRPLHLHFCCAPSAPCTRWATRVRLSVLAPGASGRAFVDVVKAGRTVLTQGLDLRDGRGVLALDLPPDLFGTLELRAYRLLASGDIAGDTRIVQVNPPAGLRIAVELDKPTYRPGEKALLRFAVTRPDGTPAVAALGLSAVDEAVFALQEMRPGLERVFFMLQEELLKPRYEIHAAVPPEALSSSLRPRPDRASRRRPAWCSPPPRAAACPPAPGASPSPRSRRPSTRQVGPTGCAWRPRRSSRPRCCSSCWDCRLSSSWRCGCCGAGLSPSCPRTRSGWPGR